MDFLFNISVEGLRWLGDVTGLGYVAINVIIFLMVEPLIFLWMLYKIIILNNERNSYRSMLGSTILQYQEEVSRLSKSI